jgi:tetratricopeptide (TPR) repeat protein
VIRNRVLLAVAAALALAPMRAAAQPESFIRAAQELAEASRLEKPARSNGVRRAADRMGAALAEWDRRIGTMESAAADGGYLAHLELGVAYHARGRAADALREFDAAAARQPAGSDIHVLRALALEAAGRFEEAERAFLAAWTRDAGNPVKAYYVARRRRDGKDADRDRARALLTEAYRRLPPSASRPATLPFQSFDVVHDNLPPAPVVGDEATAEGFELLVVHKYSEAVAALQRAASSDGAGTGESPLGHFARAQRAEADNRVADARREYLAALPGAIGGRNAILIAIARLAQVEGDSAGAVDALNQAARLNPNDLNVRKELAAAYAASGQSEEAFCELMAALLIDPRQAQVHVSIGQLYLDTGRATDAVTAFTRALELSPRAYEIRYSLATAYTRLGKPVDAARELEVFDRMRREALEKRRRDIANEVDQAERERAR